MSLVTKEVLRPTLRPVANLIGNSDTTNRMRKFAEKAARTDHTLLVLGETGVGKDLLAAVIHLHTRASAPFVNVDCGSLSDTLAETEFFGHTAGAFTDARGPKPGLIQIAEDGTLFLNEVANMSLKMQARLLRLLEKRTYRSVGGVKEIPINTRIIAATNINLESAVKRGTFRSDLYYRLNVISFNIPPLRKRQSDIPDLVQHFLEQGEGSPKTFSPDAMAVMLKYNWPGNVRELQNIVGRATFLAENQTGIHVKHVQPFLRGTNLADFPTFQQVKRRYLRAAIRAAGGNITHAARLASIGRVAMHENIAKFGLEEFVSSARINRRL